MIADARGEEGSEGRGHQGLGGRQGHARSPSRRWISRASRGCSSTRSRSSTRSPRTSTCFTIKEAKDSYRSRQKLKYPDGTTVEDTGRAHVDGYSEFKLINITPAARSSCCAAWTTCTATTSSSSGERQEGRRRVVCRHGPRASLAQLAGDDHRRQRQGRTRCSCASSRSPPAATSTCSTSGSSAEVRDPATNASSLTQVPAC